MTTGPTAVRPPAGLPPGHPAAVGWLDGPVLTCADTDQSVRWTPGERLHELFERRCDRFRAEGDAGHLAVARGDLALTYDELDARANRTARWLRAHGVGPGHRIGLLVDDAVAAYVGMLAALKVHAAYVPLDVAFPPDRLAYITDDAGVSTVLTLAHLRDRLAEAGVDVLCTDEAADDIGARDPARLTADERGEPVEDLCYVIYTSGTTGRPKGVPIDHASITNFVRVAAEVYGVVPQDRMYQGMTIAFDFSVEEIWVPLAVGATLVPKPGGSLLGEELADFLRAAGVTALCCVPTLLATVDDDLPHLRFLLVSGEACPQDLVTRWYRPDRRFLNVYGPTETTVTTTWTTLHPDRPVTIGVPLPTYAVVILDPDDQRPLPPGELGEIGIAGVGLSSGYLNRDDLTAKAFLPDPLGIAHNTSGRIYRSGDLGRITPDGQVECLGRIDTQVKVRGYRIELTEIESVLLRLAGIAAAVVDTHEPEPGRVELVAYYTERPGGPPVTAADIHAALTERLPRYMVPTYVERLARIPMLPSDKADRKNLPAPTGTRLTSQRAHVEPATEVERVLAGAVADLLGLDRVSADSDFFDDLGMSSLGLARLRARLRDHPRMPPVTMKDAYLNPSVRALAAAVGDPADRPATTAPREVRVAGTTSYLLCGLAQVLLYLGVLQMLFLSVVTGYHWVQAATGPLEGYLRIVAFGALFFGGTALLPVVAKWLLIGRWQPGTIPLWGWRYLRFWAVRQLLRISPLNLFSGSPLYLLYLRALGARIGRGAAVFTRSLPVSTDLLTIGDGAVVRKDTVLPGYHAESGWIRVGRIDLGRDAVVGEASVLDVDTALGDGAQLGHASSLAAGQRVPPGERYAGSPAQPTRTDFTGVETLPCTTRRRATYAAFQLAMVLLVSGPLLAAVPLVLVPAVYARVSLAAGAQGAGWADPAFYLVHLGVAAAVLAVTIGFRLAVVVLAPRLLDRLPGTDTPHPLYGVRYAAHRAVARLGNSRFFNDLLGDSSYIVGFLRATGYHLHPVEQTGSNFGLATRHDSPRHVRVGTGTLVSDGLSLMNAEYSSSSFAVSPVAVGARSFLGNNVAFPARAAVGADVLLATKVMVPIDGPRRSGVGLLGSPAFEIPRSTQGDPELDALRTGPGFPARLARKNRANLGTVAVFLVQRVLLLFGLVLVFVGAHEFEDALGPTAYLLGALAALACTAVLSIGFERLSMGQRRLRPEFCSIYQPYYWRHERLWKLSRISVLPLFNGTPMKAALWRALGVRMGRKVFDDGAVIPEKTLVSIGDHSTLNTGTVIQCHSLEDASFRSDRTEVGAGVTLGVNSFVHYGVRIGDRAVLDADSFLMKGEAPAADTRWRGNPATEIPEPAVAPVTAVTAVTVEQEPASLPAARDPRWRDLAERAAALGAGAPGRGRGPIRTASDGEVRSPAEPRSGRPPVGSHLGLAPSGPSGAGAGLPQSATDAAAGATPAPDRAPRRRSPIPELAVAALGILAVVRVALSAFTLPATAGEAELVDGAFGALRGLAGPWSPPGFTDLAGQLQLQAYAGLTGAFDRYPGVLGAARELAVVAVAVLVGAAVVAARRAGTRPWAVAAALALLIVGEPAVTALATFGPGLLGAMWLVLGLALISGTGRIGPVLGVLAAAVGVLTAPVLGAAVAVAAIAVGRRHPVALPAALLGVVALAGALVAGLAPTAATGAVDGPGRWLLLAAGAVVVLGAFALPGLRGIGATAAAVLVPAALPWPGAVVALPGLVAASLLLAAALGQELAGEPAARSRLRHVGAVVVAAAACVAALATTAAGAVSSPGAAAVSHRELAAWLASASDPAATVAAPPGVRSDLVRDGVPAERFAVGGVLVVSAGSGRTGSPGGGSVLARFGEGADLLEVRAAGGAVPPAPARLADAGAQLAGNPNLAAPTAVRDSLRDGAVDPRALVVLAGLAGRGPVTVTDLPVVPGEDPALPRHRVVLAGLDPSAREWLAAQQAPFAPVPTGSPDAVTLTWPVPAPADVLPG